MSPKTCRVLSKHYTTGPSAFGSKANFTKRAKIPKRKAELFLHSIDAYTKFGKTVRKFPRLPANARYINEIWAMDLAFVDRISHVNNNCKYLLVCIDLFSRYVRVEPMSNKFSTTCREAFLRMITKNKGKTPTKLWVDEGTEFKGEFKNTCRRQDIEIYHTFSDLKSCYAERAIQSLKNIIARYLEFNETDRYIDKLQTLVNVMNSRVNRNTGKAPAKMTNSDFLRALYKKSNPVVTLKKQKQPKFEIGDFVRLQLKQTRFTRGYAQGYSNEVFKISEITTRSPVVTYRIIDLQNEQIKGRFYERELIKVVQS